jgi:hypothetical protein
LSSQAPSFKSLNRRFSRPFSSVTRGSFSLLLAAPTSLSVYASARVQRAVPQIGTLPVALKKALNKRDGTTIATRLTSGYYMGLDDAERRSLIAYSPFSAFLPLPC